MRTQTKFRNIRYIYRKYVKNHNRRLNSNNFYRMWRPVHGGPYHHVTRTRQFYTFIINTNTNYLFSYFWNDG